MKAGHSLNFPSTPLIQDILPSSLFIVQDDCLRQKAVLQADKSPALEISFRGPFVSEDNGERDRPPRIPSFTADTLEAGRRP